MSGMLAEWAVRATLLAGVTAALLWLFRIRNVHVRLTVWTTVLAAVLLMPGAGRWLPGLPFTVPGESAPAIEGSAEWAPGAFPIPPARTAKTPRPGPDIAAVIWLLPALFLLARLMIGVHLSGRLVRDSRPVRDGVRESERLRVPITVGLLRPVAVLPADWRSWPADRLRAVLEHEQAHVRRRDPLRQFLASVYCAICWFHPLAWWLKAQLADLAEAASDDLALAAGGDRIGYAETLVAFFEAAHGRVRYQGAAMATHRTRARRIDRVLDSSRPPAHPPRLAAVAGLVMGALALGFVAAVARPVQAQAPVPSPPPPAAPAPKAATGAPKTRPVMCGGSGPYRKWLNEDAAYIMTREERQEFTGLTTPTACEAFIERFWEAREPEFKEEHYRRVAYANERFASDVPGWRTDRGRIYITYGPPDEHNSHPSGPGYPYEEWTWYRLNGEQLTLRFVDRSGHGDYRLEKPARPQVVQPADSR